MDELIKRFKSVMDIFLAASMIGVVFGFIILLNPQATQYSYFLGWLSVLGNAGVIYLRVSTVDLGESDDS